MFGMFDKMDFTPSSTEYNWDLLATTGKVTVNRETDKKTGLTTVTRTYTSNNGLFEVSSQETYFASEDTYRDLDSKKKELTKAISEERFEDCISIKKEIDEIKKSFKKTNKN